MQNNNNNNNNKSIPNIKCDAETLIGKQPYKNVFVFWQQREKKKEKKLLFTLSLQNNFQCIRSTILKLLVTTKTFSHFLCQHAPTEFKIEIL